MKNIRTPLLVAALGATLSLWGVVAQAQTDSNHNSHHGQVAQTNSPAKTAQGTGIIKKIDVTGSRITLAHDPIKALNWPAMTMPFTVKDKVLLKGLKSGDKVQFELQNEQTITKLKKI